MKTSHDNKWRGGVVDWGQIILPEVIRNQPGISLLKTPIHDLLPEGQVLFLQDPTDFIYQIAKITPFQLWLKTGVVRTQYGPLMFLLWYLPNPKSPDSPFAMFETTLNIHNVSHIRAYEELAAQPYWHVFIVDHNGDVLDMFEFENNFGLGESIEEVRELCREMPCIDFDKAKKEYNGKYSLTDLFQMSR